MCQLYLSFDNTYINVYLGKKRENHAKWVKLQRSDTQYMWPYIDIASVESRYI